MKKILILGAAGFIGSALEHRLKRDGHFVVSVARRPPQYRKSVADEFNFLDLANESNSHAHFFRYSFDEVYQLASDVGGLNYIGTGDNDANILTNSLKINLFTLEAMRRSGSKARILFASSQCVYPDIFDVDPFAGERIVSELDLMHSAPRETDASFNTFAFGQEKLFSEKLYDAYARNHDFDVRIARLGNTYGPFCTWDGNRAKAPAAICRKVAQAPYAGVVDLIGDGQQTRSFTYIDDAVEGLIRLMASDYNKPVNIAHSETVTIAELFDTICRAANKVIAWRQMDGPTGVRSRGSDNTLCRQVLGWEPSTSLWYGMGITYPWVREQVEKSLTKAQLTA